MTTNFSIDYFKRGAVYWTEYKYQIDRKTRKENVKYRPFVVLSDDCENSNFKYQYLQGIFLFSNGNDNPYGVEIYLEKKCYAYANQIRLIRKDAVHQYMGVLSPEEMEDIELAVIDAMKITKTFESKELFAENTNLKARIKDMEKKIERYEISQQRHQAVVDSYEKDVEAVKKNSRKISNQLIDVKFDNEVLKMQREDDQMKIKKLQEEIQSLKAEKLFVMSEDASDSQYKRMYQELLFQLHNIVTEQSMNQTGE